MKKNILVSLIGFFLSLILSTYAFSLTLYDDFSGTYIDKTKWKEGEWVSEISDGKLILKQASPSPIVIGTYPYDDYNFLSFSDPDSFNSIQADVTILQNNITNQAYTRARIGGRWYYDGTPGGGVAGDIWAEVLIMWTSTGFKGYWYVGRYTGSSSASLTKLGSGYFTTVINIGTQYRLYASYDSVTNQFLFKIGDEAATFGPTGLPTRVGYANQPWKGLQTTVNIDNSTSSGYISAAFDNVYKNGVLYDDFSSPTIDPTKWTSYESVREIASGKFRSKVRSSSGSVSSITSVLEFPFPSSVNAIQTEVTPLIFNNTLGTSPRAHIIGIYYNDGTPGGGYIGDVGAQVRIGGSGTNPIAEWNVWKCTDLACNSPVGFAGGTFTTTITLGETYTLFLGWNGSQFTFRIDNEVAFYTPTTNINPPNNPYKRIRTQISIPSNKEATIEALFDNVLVDRAFIPHPWEVIPGSTPSSPALAWNSSANELQMVVRGGDDSIWTATFNSSGVFNNDWASIPGNTPSVPALAWNPVANKLQIVVRASNDSIWAASFNSSGVFNNDWTPVPGSTPSTPALVGI